MTHAIESLTVELLEAAADLADEVRAIPSWVDMHAGVDVPRGYAKNVLRLLELIKRAREASRPPPATIEECLSRIAARSDMYRLSVDVVHGYSVATDGTVLVSVPGDLRRSYAPRWASAEKASKATGPILDVVREPLGNTSLGDIERCITAATVAIDDVYPVVIGSRAFDSQLISLWVANFARLMPGTIAVSVGELDARFDGPGWTSIVMSIRDDSRRATESVVPRLAVSEEVSR